MPLGIRRMTSRSSNTTASLIPAPPRGRDDTEQTTPEDVACRVRELGRAHCYYDDERYVLLRLFSQPVSKMPEVHNLASVIFPTSAKNDPALHCSCPPRQCSSNWRR